MSRAKCTAATLGRADRYRKALSAVNTWEAEAAVPSGAPAPVSASGGPHADPRRCSKGTGTAGKSRRAPARSARDGASGLYPPSQNCSARGASRARQSARQSSAPTEARGGAWQLGTASNAASTAAREFLATERKAPPSSASASRGSASRARSSSRAPPCCARCAWAAKSRPARLASAPVEAAASPTRACRRRRKAAQIMSTAARPPPAAAAPSHSPHHPTNSVSRASAAASSGCGAPAGGSSSPAVAGSRLSSSRAPSTYSPATTVRHASRWAAKRSWAAAGGSPAAWSPSRPAFTAPASRHRSAGSTGSPE